MALKFTSVAKFWDILHKAVIRQKFPNSPLMIAAQNYRAYLLSFGKPGVKFVTDSLVVQINLLKERGVFKENDLADDEVKEIVDDLSLGGEQHKALIRDTLVIEFTEQITPDIITSFVNTLDAMRSEEKSVPVEITRPNERHSYPQLIIISKD